ncbi:hypothetical protein KNO15_07450 [Leifsonia shinshuensis]|uniref:hypothetical protein n=1 Tax=Leifsonia shinshuensis TaxID=150026 RepID=UPI001F509F41|nr:hypothetical protein [Leifsonia shinshuensis]MCI0156530.1 hypothetical protein [Leifsonia shinshuensis]
MLRAVGCRERHPVQAQIGSEGEEVVPENQNERPWWETGAAPEPVLPAKARKHRPLIIGAFVVVAVGALAFFLSMFSMRM